MAGGVLAAFIGPQTAKYTVDLFAPVTFAGVYIAVVVYSALSLLVIQGLKIPGLKAEDRTSKGRPMLVIARQPTYVVAIISSMFGYGVMALVMSATPLAMLGCGFSFNASATVIQAHVVGMFLPSFFTGHLIARFGALPIIAAGAFIQMGCAAVNVSGIEFMNFFIANVLVGIGWNFTYIGGSTLLTRTYRAAERAKVQASHDFVVFATTALAAGLAGVLHARIGWTYVNLAALPMMLVVMLSALWLARYQRRTGDTMA